MHVESKLAFCTCNATYIIDYKYFSITGHTTSNAVHISAVLHAVVDQGPYQHQKIPQKNKSRCWEKLWDFVGIVRCAAMSSVVFQYCR